MTVFHRRVICLTSPNPCSKSPQAHETFPSFISTSSLGERSGAVCPAWHLTLGCQLAPARPSSPQPPSFCCERRRAGPLRSSKHSAFVTIAREEREGKACAHTAAGGCPAEPSFAARFRSSGPRNTRAGPLYHWERLCFQLCFLSSFYLLDFSCRSWPTPSVSPPGPQSPSRAFPGAPRTCWLSPGSCCCLGVGLPLSLLGCRCGREAASTPCRWLTQKAGVSSAGRFLQSPPRTSGRGGHLHRHLPEPPFARGFTVQHPLAASGRECTFATSLSWPFISAGRTPRFLPARWWSAPPGAERAGLGRRWSFGIRPDSFLSFFLFSYYLRKNSKFKNSGGSTIHKPPRACDQCERL